MWNDPQIQALNPAPTCRQHRLALSSAATSPVRRTTSRNTDGASNGAWGKGASEITGCRRRRQQQRHVGPTVTTDLSITYNEGRLAVGKQLNMGPIITSAGPIQWRSPLSRSARQSPADHGDKATTWYWTRRRSTGPPSLVFTRSCWRPMRSSARNTRMRRPVLRWASVYVLQIGPGQEGLDQYGSIPLPKSFQAKLAAAVNAIS